MISVFLPTYNEKDNIGSLIREIQAQRDGSKYEIIVVDDDSPAGTWEMVHSIEREDKRFCLLRVLVETD